MRKQRESKLLSIITSVVAAVGILAGSIAVPILCRPFYDVHIQPLFIPFRTGLSEWKVRETYGEVMDYCLGLADNFELTHLTLSAEGAAHFADVRELFILDLVIAGASILILGMLWSVGRYTKVKPARIKGHGPGFWAATNLGVAFAVLGVLAAMDFDRFFTAFHKVFFPGKENWIFDPDTDPVIEMLPQTFFRNCGMLVLGLILGCCIILMLHDMGTRHSNERK